MNKLARPLRFLAATAFALPLLVSTTKARAQAAPADGFGLGLDLGTNGGLSAKWFLNRENALQFGLGFDWTYYHSPAATVDYLWHPVLFTEGPVMRLVGYLGIGGAIGFGRVYDPARNTYYGGELGVRVPFGLDFLFNQQPFDLYLEITPVLDLVPFWYPDVWGALGGRFYF